MSGFQKNMGFSPSDRESPAWQAEISADRRSMMGHPSQIKRRRGRFSTRFYLHEKMMKSFIHSYLLVFFLPATLIYMTMFYSGYTHVRENNLGALESTAAQTRAILDNELYSMLSICTSISMDSDYLSISSISAEELNEKTTMMMYSLSRQFRKMYSLSNQFMDIVLYLPTNGYCISTQHAIPFDASELVLNDIGTGITNQNTWAHMYNDVIASMSPLIMKNEKGAVVFAKCLPQVGSNMGIMIIPIRPTYLKNLLTLENASWTFGGIVSTGGEVLFSAGISPTELSQDHFAGAKGYFASGSNVYVYSKLENAGAYVIFGVLDSALNVNLSQKMLLYVLALLITVGLFAVLTFRCAVRNYNPIKQLCDLAASENGRSETGDLDACLQLHESLVEAIDVKREMETSRQIVSEIDYGTRLYAAMCTSQADQLIENLFDMRAIEAGDYDWACVKVRLTDCFSNLFATSVPEGALNFDWMPLFSDCLTQMLGDEARIVAMFSIDSLLFLIRYDREVNLRRHLKLVRQMLVDNYSFETTIAVSRRHQGSIPFDQVFRRTTDECNFLLGSSAASGKDGILWYGELFNGSDKIPRETIVLERALTEKLNRGEVKKALAILDRMRVQLTPIAANDALSEEKGTVSRQELAAWIRSIVEQEYASPDLNVAGIAEHVGKSPEYVSRCFRMTYEIGLLDYIHKVRIRHAKVLLSEVKDVSISAVAKMVGYSNVDSYIRVFKKLEAMTPGAYQKAICSEEPTS